MSTSPGIPAVTAPTEPPHLIRSDAETVEIAHGLAAEFAVEASRRDRERRHPLPELDRFSQSGLWAMNVPRAFGGPALSYATVAKVFSLIAAADASIGQIAQNHVSLIDGSGTVLLEEVPVTPEQILPTHLGVDIPSVHGAVAQIIQAAIDAGIARAAVDATVEAVRGMARPWVDSGRDRACEDPLTIREVGRLKMRLHAAEAVLEEAGLAIDAGLLDENEDTAAMASIAVAEAKVLTTEIALDAANKLFELAGTRSVLAAHNLDRFWRDARTHTPHDPVRWKFHAIGNYVLNGVNPPRHSAL